jgi:hypothetical protein
MPHNIEYRGVGLEIPEIKELVKLEAQTRESVEGIAIPLNILGEWLRLNELRVEALYWKNGDCATAAVPAGERRP